MVNKKVLIIEDEESVLKVLSTKFTHEGFTVFEARDGEEGLELALKEKPDLIMLDVVMPRMDGLTMLKKLREDVWGKKVPVMILTNLSDDKNIAEAMIGGVYDFLVKSSWDIEDVIKRAKERLNLS